MCVCRSESEEVPRGSGWLDALRVSDRYDGLTDVHYLFAVAFDHLDFYKHQHSILEFATVSLRHIPHVIMLLLSLENGDLFLWGSNKHSQLLSSEPFLSSPTPVKRSLLGGETVLGVWSGWTHIVAQTGEAS